MALGPLRLDNRIQHYAWGSPSAIPELLGRGDPSGDQPCAELWMGAHPRGPSEIADGSGRSLSQLVEQHPVEVLGEQVARRFASLPFLFKVLAAARPLSIQCHPDAAQALAGFEREERAGVPRDAAERNYRDSSHKPELIVALTPFFALKGFRSGELIAEALRAHGVHELERDVTLRASSGDLRGAFEMLLRLDAERRGRAIEQLSRGVADPHDDRSRWVRRLLELHPDDAGVFAPLWLQLVELAPGEALYLGARELHAYLEGTGLELMASSDNVLRGGLTPKHVDVDELLSVLRFEPSEIEVLGPTPVDGQSPLQRYATPAVEFELCQLGLTPEEGATVELGSVAIALCTEGRARVTAGSEMLQLARGTSLLLPASCRSVRFEGDAKVFIARVPAG